MMELLLPAFGISGIKMTDVGDQKSENETKIHELHEWGGYVKK